MKASYVGAVAVALGIAVAFLAYPAFANTSTSASSSPTPLGHAGHGILHRIANFLRARPARLHGAGTAHEANFSVGQAISVTSTSGTYFVSGTHGKSNGTASGSLVFTVNGKLASGYVVGVTGSIEINGTSYQVSSGSGGMGPGGATILASGSTSSGTFILRATAVGGFGGTTNAHVGMDISTGTTEYFVSLAGEISA